MYNDFMNSEYMDSDYMDDEFMYGAVPCGMPMCPMMWSRNPIMNEEEMEEEEMPAIEQGLSDIEMCEEDYEDDCEEEYCDESRSPRPPRQKGKAQIDRILMKIERNNPGIFRTLRYYGVPYPAARMIVRRVIRLTLMYQK